MATFLLSFLLLLLSLAAFGIGLLAGRGPPAGGCGSASCLETIDCGACPRRRGHG